MNRTLLAFVLLVALGAPLVLAGAAAGLEGWALFAVALPVVLLASLVDRDGFYGRS
jgi:hypothetical protein